MSGLADIRKEMAQVVRDAAPGLTVLSFEHPDPPAPAALITWNDPIPFEGGTADGALRFDLVVRIVVGTADPLLTTNGIDALLTSAIPTAIRDHDAKSWKTANPAFINPPLPGLNNTLTADLVISVHAIIERESTS